ncbi:MAG: dienelactone hydrolase [Actinomycetota bacterium]
MVQVVLFHHVLGLTDGVRDLAERLSAGGSHQVSTPDLYGGEVAGSLEDGFAIKERLGDDVLTSRAEAALVDVLDDAVYAGISLGVLTAQRFAQTRPGARGALLYEACVPTTGDWAFGPWPDGVAVQVHGKDDDEFFAHEGDLDAARALVEAVGPDRGEVFAYPGDEHLFVDSSLPSFDAEACALAVERSVAFLDRIG